MANATPVCSKIMIAKALANESSLNCLYIKGPEVFSKLVGESWISSSSLVASINRPDMMDLGLLRPGRFDRVVYGPLANIETIPLFRSVHLLSLKSH